MQGILRPATGADADAIGSVHYQAWMETYTGLIHPAFLAARSPAKSAALFRSQGCENTWVAVVADAIVGFCGYGPPRGPAPAGAGEVYGLYVLRAFQRQAIGSRLLREARSALRQQGFQTAFLWVLAGNAPAMAFYQKQGFRFDGTSKTETLVEPVVEQRWVCTL